MRRGRERGKKLKRSKFKATLRKQAGNSARKKSATSSMACLKKKVHEERSKGKYA